MADDKIKLSIELEEGSVKKSFDNIRTESKNTAKEIEKDFGKSSTSLVDGIGKVSLAVAGIGAAAYALKKAFETAIDFALIGEKVGAINKQFETIAAGAGLAADVLRNDLVGSLDGLVDDEDALQMATKSIVALGSAASSLPQLFENARSASRALGTDFKSTAEAFSFFVETGNARALKQYGIILDTSKAFEEYAKSIGVSVAQLNEAQMQQIRMNQLLEVSSKKFASTQESITPLADSIQRLKVSLGDANDAFGEFVKRNYGDFFTSLANGFSDFVKSASGTTTVKDKIRQLNDEIDKTQLRLNEMSFAKFERDGLTGLKAFFQFAKDNEGPTKVLNANIQKTKDQLSVLRAELVSLTKASDDAKAKTGTAAPATGKGTVDGPDQKQIEIALNAQKEREFQLTQFLSQQAQARSQIKQLEVTEYQTANERKAAADMAFGTQIEQITLANNAKLLEIDKNFSEEKGFSDLQRTQAQLAQIQTFNEQKQALELQNAEQMKLINEQIAVDSMTTFDLLAYSFSATFDKMTEKIKGFAINAGKNFQFVKEQAANALANGTTQAFSKFGQALGRGEDAGKAFLASVADTISQVAVQFGNFFIQTGIGKVALSYGTDATGYAMIAAGIALNALAGSLGGGGGGGSGSASSASSSGGGGPEASPDATTPVDVVDDAERAKAQTTVSVNIQGDVLDSEETGLRIVDILNKSFNQQGVVIKSGILA